MSLQHLPSPSLSDLEKGPFSAIWSQSKDPRFAWRCTGNPILYTIKIELVKEKSLALRAVCGLIALFALSLFIEMASQQIGPLSSVAPVGLFLGGNWLLFKWLAKVKKSNEQVQEAREQNLCFVKVGITFGNAEGVKTTGLLHKIDWMKLFEQLHPRL